MSTNSKFRIFLLKNYQSLMLSMFHKWVNKKSQPKCFALWVISSKIWCIKLTVLKSKTSTNNYINSEIILWDHIHTSWMLKCLDVEGRGDPSTFFFNRPSVKPNGWTNNLLFLIKLGKQVRRVNKCNSTNKKKMRSW